MARRPTLLASIWLSPMRIKNIASAATAPTSIVMRPGGIALNFTPNEELLESYSTQYFLKLSSEAGMCKIKEFKVYAITPQASEAFRLLRRGEAFELSTFVRYAANTPCMSAYLAEFKVEATV